MSEFINIVWDSGAETTTKRISVCGSHFHHYLTMLFFDFEIWVNQWKDKIEFFTAYIAFKNRFAVRTFHLSSFRFFPIFKSKKFRNPFNLGFSNTGKFQNTTMMRFFKWISMFYIIHIKTPVSVYVTSKIGTVNFIHDNPSVKCNYTLNSHCEQIDCVRPERLNEWNPKGYAKVCSARKHAEGDPKRFPRLEIGHKSNRMPVLNSAAARLGQAARETQDLLVRDSLESSASVINCVGGVNGDLPTEMAISDVDDVVTVLQNNSGEYITNMIGGENKFGTSPLGDSYICMLTTRMIPVLNNVQGFIRKFQYPNATKSLSSEWGGVNNVRFFISEQGSVSPNASLLGNDVANCFVAAKESYKVVWQAGGKMKFIYMPPGLTEQVQDKFSLIDLELLAA